MSLLRVAAAIPFDAELVAPVAFVFIWQDPKSCHDHGIDSFMVLRPPRGH